MFSMTPSPSDKVGTSTLAVQAANHSPVNRTSSTLAGGHLRRDDCFVDSGQPDWIKVGLTVKPDLASLIPVSLSYIYCAIKEVFIITSQLFLKIW